MLFWEIKVYFYLGRKEYNKVSEVLDNYLKKRGETFKYCECCLNYYYEINNINQSFIYLQKCIHMKKISSKVESWDINTFVRDNILKKKYQEAARYAMGLANLQNLSNKNRVLLLQMLEYIKTKL